MSSNTPPSRVVSGLRRGGEWAFDALRNRVLVFKEDQETLRELRELARQRRIGTVTPKAFEARALDLLLGPKEQ